MTKIAYNCPIEVTMAAIGGKWKCVILWWLRRDGKRFGELMLLLPGVSSKVLTQQLRELEADGLIHRETYREAPPRVEYRLTPLGETLIPIADLMCAWGKAKQPEHTFSSVRLGGMKVLLVASDATEGERLRSLLTNRSAEVWLAATTDEALAQIERQPELLVVDLESCGEWGLALLERIRSQGRNLPALALIAEPRDRVLALRSGFQVHLLKPFEPIELTATLGSLATEGA